MPFKTLKRKEMSKTTTNLHCDTCSNGIVIVKETKSGSRIHLRFYDCNVCKKPFGLLSAGNLKIVKNENKESEVSND